MIKKYGYGQSLPQDAYCGNLWRKILSERQVTRQTWDNRQLNWAWSFL